MSLTKEGIVRDRREMLKVKLKSLADEARIIRFEEGRTRGAIRDELYLHRKGVVRYETRATHIAYGMVKGVPLERIEQPVQPRDAALWKKVHSMIERYGPTSTDAKKQLLERCKD